MTESPANKITMEDEVIGGFWIDYTNYVGMGLNDIYAQLVYLDMNVSFAKLQISLNITTTFILGYNLLLCDLFM